MAVEGPLIKDKASFLVAGRRSYIDVLAAPFLGDDLADTRLNFYDLTLKTNLKAGKKTKFSSQATLGATIFALAPGRASTGETEREPYVGTTFSTTGFLPTLPFTPATTTIKLTLETMSKTILIGTPALSTTVLNPSLLLHHPNNILRFGGQTIYYRFEPANAIAASVGEIVDISLDQQRALESSFFLENEVTLSRLKVNYGLRISHFAYLGGREVYTYGPA
ncbi:MAG: hypothetical protein HC821_05710, partial [Lewinella sp.]|nr:hypothetical protein [Lewinella sp.]